jgi:hypothetical protein
MSHELSCQQTEYFIYYKFKSETTTYPVLHITPNCHEPRVLMQVGKLRHLESYKIKYFLNLACFVSNLIRCTSKCYFPLKLDMSYSASAG